MIEIPRAETQIKPSKNLRRNNFLQKTKTLIFKLIWQYLHTNAIKSINVNKIEETLYAPVNNMIHLISFN